jgi:pimeloyl-ACP methyl ester carboxylesterase
MRKATLTILVLVVGFSSAAVSLAQQRRQFDLPPLLVFNNGAPVTTPQQWQQRRAEVLALAQQTFIGAFPERPPKIIKTEIISQTVASDGSTRRNVRLTFDTPHKVSFEMWVLTPQGKGPRPLLLLAPRYYQIAWAEGALARGYVVCLYPGVDSNHNEPGFPNYESVWQRFQDEYPNATWSEIATKAWIAGRALDYLLDPAAGYNINAGQVAIIGHSRYGKQSLIAGAIDPRITAVVARSAGTPGSAPYRFASRTGCNEAPCDFPGKWFLPSLRSYVGREEQMPFDAHCWTALIAPRHVLMDTAYQDDGDPTYAVERGYEESSKVFRLLGVEDHCRIDFRDGWHNPITPARVNRNLDWFDAAFKRGSATKSAFPQKYVHKFDWDAWQAQLTPQEKQNPFTNPAPRDNADRKARILWALGQPPAKQPFVGRRTFYTAYEAEMMEYDSWAPPGCGQGRPATTRVPVSFGHDIHGSLYYNTARSTPAPVVIWLHPYSYPIGYAEAYGVEGMATYHSLAHRGYAVLCFDQVGFGLRLLEGRDFYQKHPKSSRLGRMIEDVRAAVDFIVDGTGAAQGPMPKLDRNQVHVLGYSLGGMVGLYSAAMDNRIKSVASFAGFTPMRTNTADKQIGGLEQIWQRHALQPMLGLFQGRQQQLPYDFDDVLALVAPRPCLIYSPQHDRYADWADVTACVDRAKAFWRGAGAADRLTQLSPDDYSRLQATQHQVYLDWLGKVLALPPATAQNAP